MSNIKILSAVLSFLLLFAISCSNEGTTGGDTGENYNYFSVSEEFGNSRDITLVSQTSSSSVYSAGTVGFSVYGSTSYGVSIESVDSGSNPLVLVADDFRYTESTKELTLSYSGLTKYQSASLTAKQKYQYTITFKFTDYSSVDTTDTKTLNVTVNLIKAQMITKTDIENMMKNAQYSETATKTAGKIIFSTGSSIAEFDFSTGATFSSSTPNFSSTATMTALGNMEITASSKAFSVASAIAQSTQFKEYFGSSFSDIDYNSLSTTINSSKKECTFTMKFKQVKSGYALSSEVSRLTTSGLTIRLILKDSTVAGNNYTASWK